MTTHHLTSDDMRTYGPDSMGEGRRGITPEQRRELERLIDVKVSAAITYGVSGVGGRASAEATLSQAGTDLMRYLDEITDYSIARAEQ